MHILCNFNLLEIKMSKTSSVLVAVIFFKISLAFSTNIHSLKRVVNQKKQSDSKLKSLIINDVLEKWRGNSEQVDDFCVIGVSI
jgi:hypothetical protein